MQISVPWSRGQAKPFGSIPRINRDHPLVQGLAIYTYDVGGVIFDLINGSISKVVTAAGLSNAANPVGGGLKFTGSAVVILPQNPAANNLGSTLPYSIATGTFYTGSATAITPIVANCAVNNTENTGPAFITSISSGSVMAIGFDNGNTIPNYNQAIAANTFQSWVAVATSASTALLYANGKLDSSVTGISNTVFSISGSGGQVVYNNWAPNGSGAAGGIVGFIPYFAAWNRLLSASEALQLHQDPYCFLIYPEDEMFAMLVGVTGYTPYNPWPLAAPILAQ